MNYLTHFSAFSLGFSLAILLIARVSMRPKAKTVLKKIGLERKHKAKVLTPKSEPEDEVIFI